MTTFGKKQMVEAALTAALCQIAVELAASGRQAIYDAIERRKKQARKQAKKRKKAARERG